MLRADGGRSPRADVIENSVSSGGFRIRFREIFALLRMIGDNRGQPKNPGRLRPGGVAEKDMLAVRTLCWVWLVLLGMLALRPGTASTGAGPTLTGIGFAVAVLLFAFADRRRASLVRATPAWLSYVVVDLHWQLVRIASLLIFYAALLQIGRFLVIGGDFGWPALAAAIGGVLFACLAVLLVAAAVVVGGYRAAIAQGHLDRVCAAYRNEAAYSACLRDLCQAAYAVCASSSLSAEARLDRVRELVDEALGAPPPKPGEDVLAAVFDEAASNPRPRPPTAAADLKSRA
jgi:hypothetical protein